MNKLQIAVLAVCAALLGGCTPDDVAMADVETMSRIYVRSNDVVSVYFVGEDQKKLIRDEFEAWKKAGFEGFDETFIRRSPTLLITGTTTNGVSYKIDLAEDRVMVHEESGEFVDGTYYARDLTAADVRFRQFLRKCIEDGRLPTLARGRMPGEDE